MTPLDARCRVRTLPLKLVHMFTALNGPATPRAPHPGHHTRCFLRTEFATPDCFPFELNPCIIRRCPRVLRSCHTVISFLVSGEGSMFIFLNVLKGYCFPLYIIIDTSHFMCFSNSLHLAFKYQSIMSIGDR